MTRTSFAIVRYMLAIGTRKTAHMTRTSFAIVRNKIAIR